MSSSPPPAAAMIACFGFSSSHCLYSGDRLTVMMILALLSGGPFVLW